MIQCICPLNFNMKMLMKGRLRNDSLQERMVVIFTSKTVHMMCWKYFLIISDLRTLKKERILNNSSRSLRAAVSLQKQYN